MRVVLDPGGSDDSFLWCGVGLRGRLFLCVDIGYIGVEGWCLFRFRVMLVC